MPTSSEPSRTPLPEPELDGPIAGTPLAVPTEPKAHDPYAALRHTNYRRFALGFVVSGTGLQMLNTAIGWEIYERTSDPLALGYAGLARALPVILLSLPAGQIIDIVSRKRILVVTQTLFAFIAVALALCSMFHAPVWSIYAALFAFGCTRTFNGSTRGAILPELVAPEDFQNAASWNSGAFQFAALAGPLAAGALIARVHSAWPVYLLTGFSCVFFALMVLRVRPRPTPPAEGGLTLRSMVAGLTHLRREKTILAAITLDLLAVLLGGATALMPIYAKDILHADAFALGLLRAAPFVGALLMSVYLAHKPPFRRAGPALLWSVAGFGVATIVFGFSTWLPLSLLALVVAGAIDNISVVIRYVLVQMRTPGPLRGRVSAINVVFIESSNELGGFESGLVAKLLGPVFSVVSGGIGTILVAGAIALRWPQLRKLGVITEKDSPSP